MNSPYSNISLPVNESPLTSVSFFSFPGDVLSLLGTLSVYCFAIIFELLL
jgi:hypothetical protein